MFSLSICHHHDHVTQAGLKLDINHTSLLQEKKDAEKKPEEAKKPAEAKPKKPLVHVKDFEEDMVYVFQFTRSPQVT